MRLLLVEDEMRFARALSRGLRADGFQVEVAPDGAIGLERARYGEFDVVLLDVMLPRLSGYDVVRTLRAEANWVPVLMLTAKAGEHDQADGLDYGADDYLTKPFSYVVLLARLRALLRRAPDTRPVVLASGDVVLDPVARVVTVDGEPVPLTRRELGLLEFLLRNPDRAVTKIEILDHVWDPAAEVNPNAVEVYVGYLRRKLGRSLVTTVRGVGYRLDP
ncbi:MAG: response regulator transcription factor [Marmoricola sp.]